MDPACYCNKNFPIGWHWQFGHELRLPTAASTVLQHHHPDFFDVSIGALWISLDFCLQKTGCFFSSFLIKNHSRSSFHDFLYPLVNVYITMERSTMFHGKIHYKWLFSIVMLVYQRVVYQTVEFLRFFPCFLVHLPALGAPAGATVAAGSDACTIV